MRLYLSYIFLVLYSLFAMGQTISGTHVVGYVRDSVSRDAIPMVTIKLMGADMELVGSEQGGF